MKFLFILSFLIILAGEGAEAQTAYIKLGQQALMDGDFKTAIWQLEKACLVDSANANALWMLGYSYYHSQNFKRSIATYTKLIEIKPAEGTAYYYRALSKSYLAKDVQLTAADKEKNLLGAIVDLTKAITIDPTDMKCYQNRGIFYRDYGIFKLQKANKFYDKTRGINSLRASVSDLEKILSDNPDRRDIAALLDTSKQLLASASK